MSEAIKEMIKDGGRLAIFAAVSAIITYVSTQVIPTLQPSTTTLILTVVIRMIDSYIHNNEDIKANGLTPF